MKEITTYIGLLAVAIAILAGLYSIRNGIARSAAIEKGLTPKQYVDWMNNADNIK